MIQGANCCRCRVIHAYVSDSSVLRTAAGIQLFFLEWTPQLAICWADLRCSEDSLGTYELLMLRDLVS